MAYKEKNYEGIIESVASRIDAQTRSILARAKINNKDLEILPGSLLDIKLLYNEKKALSVADTSIIFEDEKKFIYKVLDNNKIDKIEIVTGVRKDGNLEVLEGLEENDKIVKEIGYEDHIKKYKSDSRIILSSRIIKKFKKQTKSINMKNNIDRFRYNENILEDCRISAKKLK